MKTKFASVISVLMALGLAACGPAPAPTLSAEDVRNTALPLAMTSVAMTQAAIPTATLIPPTPTLTFTPLPSSTPFPTSAPATLPPTEGTDPCNEPPPYEPQGATVQVTFVNKSGGSVNLSFGMTQKNSLGECGTYSVGLGTYATAVVQVLAGCYWGFAWVTGKEPSTARTVGNLCMTDPGQVWKVSIGTEVIEFD